jgi:hypothetical protein
MNFVKMIVAVAVLAVTACSVSSPVDLGQDNGSLQTAGTCDIKASPC